jgi:cobyrinic acid a,c-diamide synthase
VQSREQPHLDALIDRAADIVAAAIDLDAFAALARPTRALTARDRSSPLPPLGQRIAVARDDAFAFAYPAMLEGWRRGGAEIVAFSPLADEAPDPRAHAVFLPGGYPELHAGRLASNHAFLDGLRAAAARGAVVYGECGGYMALGRALIDAAGQPHAMAGLLPVTTSFAKRRLSLGYRAVKLARTSPLGGPGTAYRGHEFHYATVTDEGDNPLFEASDAQFQPLGGIGSCRGAVIGSFVHLVDYDAATPDDRNGLDR